ncbi:hypothetical protein BSL78_24916 [Apostichopus japonicus]|uniref:Reverse transcriptase domain-containing protein n=1 Tax=Stichopus japonicus TaxID=307972 RepID=A0A2G8JR86_STIJA|nr:hypothetical protein BSL78_24916 [Apostichopus japonicus]
MGSQASPEICDIVMHRLENQILPTDNKILKWLRYRDEILLLYDGSPQELEQLVNRLNEIHRFLKFTVEILHTESAEEELIGTNYRTVFSLSPIVEIVKLRDENVQKTFRIFEFGKILTDRPKCLALINEDYPVEIIKNEEQSRYRVIHGTFKSPFAHYLPDLVPDEVKTARFEMIVPTRWPSEKNKPVCIHLAGTGDHGFWRRRIFTAKPLIKEYGMDPVLENPFMDLENPRTNSVYSSYVSSFSFICCFVYRRSSLHNVSDLFVMGGSLMLESIVITSVAGEKRLWPSGVVRGIHGRTTDSFRLGKDFALNFPDSYIEVRNFLAKKQNSSKPSKKAPPSRGVDQQEKSTAKNEGAWKRWMSLRPKGTSLSIH